MNALMDTLGLDAVDAEMHLPFGKWEGKVRDSSLVILKKDNVLAHVITYQVTSGSKTGQEASVFYRLFKDVTFAEGHEGDPEHVVNGTALMTDDNKAWYKKAQIAILDISDKEYNERLKAGNPIKPAELKDRPVTFGTKINDAGYTNVNFVESRKETSESTSDAAVSGLL